MGVSGGGGEPLCALTVDVEAVELRRFTPAGFGILRAESSCLGALAPAGGGKYCWW